MLSRLYSRRRQLPIRLPAGSAGSGEAPIADRQRYPRFGAPRMEPEAHLLQDQVGAGRTSRLLTFPPASVRPWSGHVRLHTRDYSPGESSIGHMLSWP